MAQNVNAEVVEALKELRQGQSQLLATLQSLSNHVGFDPSSASASPVQAGLGEPFKDVKSEVTDDVPTASDDPVIRSQFGEDAVLQAPATPSSGQKSALTSRIILTYVGG